MWYIDDSFAPVNHGHVYHLTSIDGLTWSGATETNISYGQNSDVKFDPVNNVYAMFSLATFSSGQGWADEVTCGAQSLFAAIRATA